MQVEVAVEVERKITFLGGDTDDINFQLGDYPKETTCKDKTGIFRKQGELWSEPTDDGCNNCVCSCQDGRPLCLCTLRGCSVPDFKIVGYDTPAEP